MARGIHFSNLFVVFDATSTIVHVAQVVFSLLIVCMVLYELVLWDLEDSLQDSKERDDDFSVDILDIRQKVDRKQEAAD